MKQQTAKIENHVRKTRWVTATAALPDTEIFLRLPQIIGDRKKQIPPILPVGRTTFLDKVRKGSWPAPVHLTERCVAWRKSDIDRLLAELGGSK
ncbi:MAG: AlpA family phage regulatory protein [Methylobacter sp.]|nr:AlpA family phage regulatory protein [Methylobacter sp.]